MNGAYPGVHFSEAFACEILELSKEDGMKFIKHNTTHSAYVYLISKKADIIFVTEPSAEELKIAQNANIELEVMPIVKDGFVFLVNENLLYLWQGSTYNYLP